MGKIRYSQHVKLVYPKIMKERVRGWIRRLMPNAYERADVLLVRRNDRRYLRMQQKVFDRLPAFADKPSDIEIETLNKCNSTCDFCPVNRFADPRPYQRMDDALFRRIVDQLADWNFNGTLKLYSNNEPFLDTRIFEFTEYARAKLPEAFLKITTNGTALTVEKVDRVLPLLSRLVINDYGHDFRIHDRVQAIIDHVNANRPELAPRLTVGVRLLTEYNTTRAGTAPNRKVNNVVYRSRCAYPFFQMIIRPDGKVSLCCNDALGQMTLGDLSRESIRDVWASDARKSVQDAMLQGRDKIALCAGCDNLGWAKPKRIARAIESGNFTGYL